ncbi:MAG: hypothetical protein LKF61_00900 [Eggerthellaceae bacterium]|jgi:hypothetical protein|nr:hypothetical protein [Eggerthellaceae bacterium]MCH4220473.1 hypothetical protein [Eggerthellaceae bacterium]
MTNFEWLKQNLTEEDVLEIYKGKMPCKLFGYSEKHKSCQLSYVADCYSCLRCWLKEDYVKPADSWQKLEDDVNNMNTAKFNLENGRHYKIARSVLDRAKSLAGVE